MSYEYEPKVSVVIPTRGRPELLVRAVKSVLEQTYTRSEVVVVIDGPDERSSSALSAFSPARVRSVVLPVQSGGSAARNAGVAASRAPWIAFLDDDDEWLPEKLEMQVAAAQASHAKHPIVASKVIARLPGGDYIWPRGSPSLPLSEYLLARNSWRQGEGLLQTSSLLTSKELLCKVGFQTGLRKHQDWDWLLRAAAVPGVSLEFVPRPLAIWNLTDLAGGVSRTPDWQASLTWIRERRSLVTRRAYAGFLATQVASQAARQGHWRAFIPVFTEMFRHGNPKLIDVLLMIGMWVVPSQLRSRMRSGFRQTVPRITNT